MIFKSKITKKICLLFFVGNFVITYGKQNCALNTSIECTSGNGSLCKEFQPDRNKCNYMVTYKFKVCNNGSVPMELNGAGAKIGGKNVNLSFQKSGYLNDGVCLAQKTQQIVDVCDGGIPWAMIWSRGYPIQGKGDRGPLCSPYTNVIYDVPNTKDDTYCPVEAKTTCTVDRDGSDCNKYFSKPRSCGKTDVTFTHNICNNDKNSSVKFGYNTILNGKKIYPFKSKILNKDSCVSHEEGLTVDSCKNKSHRVSTGAWVAGKATEECSKKSGFDYYRLVINGAISHSKAPTPIGPVCPIEVDTTCTVGNNGVDCNKYFSNTAQCGDTAITYRYIICNKDPFRFVNYSYSIKLNGNKLRPFKSDEIKKDSCVVHDELYTINSCTNNNYVASTGAWLKGVENKTCFKKSGFKFYNVKVNYSPQSKSPIPISLICPIKVVTTCSVTSDGNDCNEYFLNTQICDDVAVKYEYTICNMDKNNPIEFDYAIKLNKVKVKPFKTNVIEKKSCLRHEITDTISSCKNAQYGASTVAWLAQKKNEECFKKSGFMFYRVKTNYSPPTASPTKRDDLKVRYKSCFIDKDSDVTCSDYLRSLGSPLPDSCEIVVEFEFIIGNDGEKCRRVNQVEVSRNGGWNKVLNLSHLSNAQKKLCGGDKISVYSKYTMDMCNMYKIGRTKMNYEFLINDQFVGNEQFILPKIESLGLTAVPTSAPTAPTNIVVSYDSCFIDRNSDLTCFDYLRSLGNPLPSSCPIDIELKFIIKNKEKYGKRCEKMNDIKVSKNSGWKKSLSLDFLTNDERLLCGGENISVYKEGSIDMCRMYSQNQATIYYDFYINERSTGGDKFILPPINTLNLTSPPTNAPTEECAISLAIKCYFQPDHKIGKGRHTVPCDQINTTEGICIRSVMFRHLSVNVFEDEPGQLNLLKSSLRNGEVDLELVSPDNPVILNPSERFKLEYVIPEVNLCKEEGLTFESTAHIEASWGSKTCSRTKRISYISPIIPFEG